MKKAAKEKPTNRKAWWIFQEQAQITFKTWSHKGVERAGERKGGEYIEYAHAIITLKRKRYANGCADRRKPAQGTRKQPRAS